MPHLIDTHCHVHFPPYEADLDGVRQRMRLDDVWGITVGTTIGNSREAIRFAEAEEGVWATVGYHPEHFSSSYRDEAEGDADTYSIRELEAVARSSDKVVAIGETGLDFFRIDEGRDRAEAERLQEQGFREQLRLAHALGLPLVIHCRTALTRLADVIQEERSSGRPVEGVVHCYTGTWEEALPLLELGLHLSFTGIITFPAKKTDDPARHVHRVIERIPVDRLLIETDAPWLTPVPHRGERNEPVHVRFVAEKVAELRRMEYEDACRRTTENARRLFKI